MAWHDGVYSKGRFFTDHEKQVLEKYARVSITHTDNGDMISAKETVVKRPMDLKLTHYNHTNALIAFISCYTGSNRESVIHYPGREIQRANPK